MNRALNCSGCLPPVLGGQCAYKVAGAVFLQFWTLIWFVLFIWLNAFVLTYSVISICSFLPQQSAEPQSTHRISEESSSIVAVQLRLPDTNTPASPNSQQHQQQQQQRSTKSNQHSSEYSLFELETFFTRWAPDNDSAVTPAATSCSYTSDDSAECDQNGVIIVDTQLQAQHVLQSPQGSSSSTLRNGAQSSQRFSSVSNGTRVDIQPTVSQSKWLSPAFVSDLR